MAWWELAIVAALAALWLFVGVGTMALVMAAVGQTHASQILLQVLQ